MSKTNTLAEDVQGLLKDSVVEEAVQAAFLRFENALGRLPRDQAEILRAFLDGQTPEKIAERLGTNASDVRAILERAKRDLRHQMRAETKMKQ